MLTLRLKNSAKQICGAICLTRFCTRHQISHESLDLLIHHLWDFARIDGPEKFLEWDDKLDSVIVTDNGTVKAELLSIVPSLLRTDFIKLVSNTQQIGICDAYGEDTTLPTTLLLETFKLLKRNDVPIPSLWPFVTRQPRTRWGLPVDTEVLKSWQQLNVL